MDKEKLKQAVRLFIEGIGDDPERRGLRRTPDRVAAMCDEILAGYGVEPASVFREFHRERHDEIVLVRDIPFYSLCEHHLLPFFGKAHVAYLPDGMRLCGISKLARIVEVHARRLQLQERLTAEIAASLVKALRPKGVMVVMEAEHLCMTMRGVRAPGSRTVTSVVRGIFRENAATRAEAMALLRDGVS
ncbi:MAG: GTP cyclohydrolase I FolE [Planctomycetes bacterium]|nr:GTP cyclohydrolase I FolE [Planctomycetota bacterium]